jgi:serine/alanine adding enzyme
MKALGDRARIFTVFLNNRVLASGLTIGYKDSLEIPWASSLRGYNKLCANTLLYWEIIKFASEKGYMYFDFGRCSLNSGTYHFKKQWGATPRQLYWYYWLPRGERLPELNPANPKYRLLIAVWQRLPLFLTNLFGPCIARSIP